MKPDWQFAPKWARFVAMDKDGGWVWYERKPYIDCEKSIMWKEESGTKFHVSADFGGCEVWKESLESRP